jgi:multiple sugar transport system permease protein
MDEALDDRRPQREGGRLGEYVLIAVFAVITIIFVMPLAVMVLSAFKPQAEILRSPPSFWPEAPTLDNFQRVLSEAPYLLWYRNSLVVAIAVTAIAVFTSAVGGYIFAKFEFPLKQPLFVLVLATLMIPFPVLLIPNYIIANRLGVLNSLWALILPGMVSAFGIFLMRQFAAGIPRDLIEAARLDGAGEWAIFGRIVLPLLRPALAALGVFTFLASWNDYLWPLVAINDLDKSTLPLALTFFSSVQSTRYDLIMAAASMAVVPVLIVFLIFQRQIVKALVLAGMR